MAIKADSGTDLTEALLVNANNTQIVGRQEQEEVTATNLYSEEIHDPVFCSNRNDKTAWACLETQVMALTSSLP